jgi:hypothetical protein
MDGWVNEGVSPKVKEEDYIQTLGKHMSGSRLSLTRISLMT